VKRLHPDRGGDRREFLPFQSHFERGAGVFDESLNGLPIAGPNFVAYCPTTR
jgi:hypothetical protein